MCNSSCFKLTPSMSFNQYLKLTNVISRAILYSKAHFPLGERTDCSEPFFLLGSHWPWDSCLSVLIAYWVLFCSVCVPFLLVRNSSSWTVYDQTSDQCMTATWSVHDQSRDQCMISHVISVWSATLTSAWSATWSVHDQLIHQCMISHVTSTW